MRTVFVSKPNKALVVPRSVGMERLFPEAKPLNEKQLVIRHGLAEYTLLRRLGFAVPNPINCYYNWAEGTPYHVQRVTCSLLTASPRAYVLNDMGTGKTRATLWAWDYLRGNNYAGKLLVVAKRSTLSLVWAHECMDVLPHRKVQVLYGSKKRRLERLADPEAEVFVINHDGMKVIQEELDARPDIDVLVIDELATYRNPNARSRAMVKFAERKKFVWGLTGSPMPNEPTDVWMQCKIITPHTVPKFRGHARDMLMIKKNDYLWLPKTDAVDRAYSWMQPAVRFALDDVVELPETLTRPIDVGMTLQQQKGYTDVKNLFLAKFQGQEVNAANAAVAVGKLLQIAGGFVYGADAQGKKVTIKLDATPRIETLIDLIQSATHKVLVFCPFRHMVMGLHEIMNGDPAKDPNYVDHAVIHGDVTDSQRNKIFDAFQNTAQYKAIIAHPGTMAHGLTLTAADTIIWYCPIPNFETYEQANARIRRIGQKHRQQIFHLHGSPVERRIYSLLTKKAAVQDMLLALFEEATTQAQQGQPTEHSDVKPRESHFVPSDLGGRSGISSDGLPSRA